MESKVKIEIRAIGTDGSVILPGNNVQVAIADQAGNNIAMHGVVTRLLNNSSIRFVDFKSGKEKILPINDIKELINTDIELHTEAIAPSEKERVI